MIGLFNTYFIPYERLRQYSALPQERQGGLTTPALDHQKLALRLDGVSVRYRQDLPLVLDGLTFQIWEGEKIGVVGSSGAGKSSLFNLFLGILTPSQGTMQLNGRDTQDLSLSSIRSHFTYISQDAFLF